MSRGLIRVKISAVNRYKQQVQSFYEVLWDAHDKQGVHVLPQEAYVRGTVYTLKDAVRDIVEARLKDIVQGYALAGGAKSSFTYERGYPVLVNSEAAKTLAVDAATSIVGTENVQADMQPVMAAEDFSFMLQHCRGCYVFIGNGGGDKGGHPCHLHNPHYDFNDEVIPIGVQYWSTLAETYLSLQQ